MKVALVGPCANNSNCHTGDYSPKHDGPIVTPLMAWQERFGAVNVLYAREKAHDLPRVLVFFYFICILADS